MIKISDTTIEDIRKLGRAYHETLGLDISTLVYARYWNSKTKISEGCYTFCIGHPKQIFEHPRFNEDVIKQYLLPSIDIGADYFTLFMEGYTKEGSFIFKNDRIKITHPLQYTE